MNQPLRIKFVAGLALGSAATFALIAALAAGPAPTGEAMSSPPPEPDRRASPSKPLSPAAAEAEAVRSEVESLDAQVQDGLTQMGRYLKEFEAERRTWVSLDMTVDAARKVNLALLSRNRTVLSLYDDRLSGPIARFKERLKEAPAAYRKLAEERKKYAAEATLETERRSYEHMERLCLAAARLCEQRHREVFDGGDGRPNAATLAETIANMRKYEVVHARWEDTFARYPSSLEDRRMAALFAHLSVYAEDLEAFTHGVEALTGAMRRKANGEFAPSLPDASTEEQSPQAIPGPVTSGGTPRIGRRASVVRAWASSPPKPDPSRSPLAASPARDILQPGAVLYGSLRQGPYTMACRVVIRLADRQRLHGDRLRPVRRRVGRGQCPRLGPGGGGGDVEHPARGEPLLPFRVRGPARRGVPHGGVRQGDHPGRRLRPQARRGRRAEQPGRGGVPRVSRGRESSDFQFHPQPTRSFTCASRTWTWRGT